MAKPTKKVAITINGSPDCIREIHDDIGVVLEGDETTRQFTASKKGPNLWVGTWKPLDPKETFEATNTNVSLRLGVGRTEWQRSHQVPDEQEEGKVMAAFTFDCDRRAVRSVEILVLPTDMHVSYVRRLPKNDTESYTEWGHFVDKTTVVDVRIPSEKLRLQIGRKERQLESPGLLVFNPTVKDPRAPDILVLEHAVVSHMKPKSDPPMLDRAGVAGAMRDQRAGGRLSGEPTFSANAYIVDANYLATLDSITLKVK